MINPPDLPHTLDALEPMISCRAVEIHYRRNHKVRVEKTDRSVRGRATA